MNKKLNNLIQELEAALDWAGIAQAENDTNEEEKAYCRYYFLLSEVEQALGHSGPYQVSIGIMSNGNFIECWSGCSMKDVEAALSDGRVDNSMPPDIPVKWDGQWLLNGAIPMVWRIL